MELHWGLSDPRFVSIDYDALWKRVLARADADAQAHGRGDLYPLPAEETLLFLALHLPKHDAGVLRLLADIDRLIRLEGPTMDWLYVLATAERWHLRWLLYFALQRSEQLLGTPVPRWVMQRVEPPAWRRGAVAILAGPEAILRPPAPEHMRVHRFRLAYCAMLSPVGRALSAYAHYLFTPYRFRRPGPLWKVMSGLEGLGRGLTWTVLVAANCLGEQRLPWQRRAQARVGSA